MTKEQKTIKKITIVSGQGIKKYEVGVNNVISIIDKSCEWENGIDFIYAIIDKNKKCICEIINCPVEINFK